MLESLILLLENEYIEKLNYFNTFYFLLTLNFSPVKNKIRKMVLDKFYDWKPKINPLIG